MNKKMHILIVSQYFYPENFRINDIAVEWVKRGYQVSVVTGIPNYPEGQYYKGYNKTERRTETWNGVNIIRLPIEPRRTGSLNLIKNYLSFVRCGKKWVRKTDLKADVVFTFEVSPMTQALVSVKYAKKKKIPHILYVTDLWPENVEIITGIHNKAIIGIIQLMVDYIYKHSQRILTCSNSFIEAITKRNVDRKKLEFWPQYAEDFYKPISKIEESEIPCDGVPNFVFAGNIGFAQGLSILPNAAKKLKESDIPVRFNVVGDGRYLSNLKELVQNLQVETFFNFIDRKPAREIPKYLAAADALLITLAKSDVFSITIPAKTQSCLACGKPIIVSADGEVQQIVKNASAGFTSDAEDVGGFVNNIKHFIMLNESERQKMAINALNYSQNYFNKEKLLERIDEIFQGGINNVEF